MAIVRMSPLWPYLSDIKPKRGAQQAMMKDGPATIWPAATRSKPNLSLMREFKLLLNGWKVPYMQITKKLKIQ